MRGPRELPLIYGAAGLGVLLGVTGLTLKGHNGAHPKWDLVFGGVAGFLFLGTGLAARFDRAVAVAGCVAVFGLPWLALPWSDPVRLGMSEPVNPLLIRHDPQLHRALTQAFRTHVTRAKPSRPTESASFVPRRLSSRRARARG